MVFPERTNGTGEAVPTVEAADGNVSLLVGVASVVCCTVKGLRAIDGTSGGLLTDVVCFFMDEVKLIVGDD